MFELLEHTADVGFRASGASLPELFEAAGEALVSTAMDVGDVSARESYPLSAEGASREALLVNWLSEILYQFDGEGRAMRQFKVDELGPSRVSGRAFGEPREARRHPGKLIIKGVTYHQLRIEQTPAGWLCEVYLDI
jgi:SHS2 domain-containing protein